MVLGLIETMKVYNEVLADERGRLVRADAALVSSSSRVMCCSPSTRGRPPGQETP